MGPRTVNVACAGTCGGSKHSTISAISSSRGRVVGQWIGSSHILGSAFFAEGVPVHVESLRMVLKNLRATDLRGLFLLRRLDRRNLPGLLANHCLAGIHDLSLSHCPMMEWRGSSSGPGCPVCKLWSPAWASAIACRRSARKTVIVLDFPRRGRRWRAIVHCHRRTFDALEAGWVATMRASIVAFMFALCVLVGALQVDAQAQDAQQTPAIDTQADIAEQLVVQVRQ